MSLRDVVVFKALDILVDMCPIAIQNFLNRHGFVINDCRSRFASLSEMLNDMTPEEHSAIRSAVGVDASGAGPNANGSADDT